jgi:hypothetical protein
LSHCGSGGIGRHTILRGWRPKGVRVQVPPSALDLKMIEMNKLVLLIFILTVFAFANTISDGSMKASSDGINITVQWGSSDETGVKDYIITRRPGSDGNFTEISSVLPKGSNYFYQFIDQSAFKSTASLYQYQIVVEKFSGSREFSSIISVTHSTNGVKRTWGSLKAMFR